MSEHQFSPRQVIFAPTTMCNLNCGHCRVDRNRAHGEGTLSIEDAKLFLQSCVDIGIERVGFSGGEPFLAIDFLEGIISKAVELDLYFDRLMTNGVWWNDEEILTSSIKRILDAGFDGILAVSLDDWHKQDSAQVCRFFSTAASLSGRYDWFEITAVTNPDGTLPLARLEQTTQKLKARLLYVNDKPAAIRDERADKNRASGADDGSGIHIPISIITYSPPASDTSSWKAERWFTDDWCEGPGQVLYVHPDGMVSVCCGFANESPLLIAGHISEGASTLFHRARTMPLVRDCYEKGLGTVRKELEQKGHPFPGKTGDMCQFCAWLCTQELYPSPKK